MSLGENDIALKRILKEIKILREKTANVISAAPVSDENLLKWSAVICGPAGSVYDGGIFELSIEFSLEYPFVPPRVKFITHIYHCNILNDYICVDILKNQWSPALTIDKVLLSISSLLADPNPYDPLNREAAEKYLSSREEHDRIAREWTRRYAMDNYDTKNVIDTKREITPTVLNK